MLPQSLSRKNAKRKIKKSTGLLLRLSIHMREFIHLFVLHFMSAH